VSGRAPLRVFLGAFGQPGHAFPMLALGAELAARGHEVTYETWSRWREPVEAHGMRFLAAPEYPTFPTQEQPLGPYEAVARGAAETRGAVAAARPDVVVHDILTLAPALAGELESVPVATLIPHVYPVMEPGFPPYAFGARLPRTVAGRRLWRAFDRPVRSGLERGRAELNETRGRLGLAPVDRLHGGLSTQLTMVGTLPPLEYPRRWPEHVHVVGPLLWEPPFEDVAPPPGDEPLVLVAPSTAQDPEHRLLRAALAGLAGEPVRVLATWNRRPLPGPVRVPANTRLVEWLSYAQTMPRCALVICHAGHGTMVRALASSCRVLAVPHVGDMAENAARVDWAGAGVRLPWPLLAPSTLRLATRRALRRAGLGERAAELGAWTARHPGPARAADLVETLARADQVPVAPLPQRRPESGRAAAPPR
jgi:MGT family glycosyltransferase